MPLIDISRPLSPSTAVWPGDQSVEWSWSSEIESGASVNVGAVRMSTHAGTHADAPRHVRAGASAIDELPLGAFVGPVDVVEVNDDAIRASHVAPTPAKRVLFKTFYSDVDPDTWRPDVCPLLVGAVKKLQRLGVKLIGTDCPSVDPLNSKDLQAHHALIDAGIVNLESLSLKGVSPGRYELIALPLRLAGADASPVRAVLRTLDRTESS